MKPLTERFVSVVLLCTSLALAGCKFKKDAPVSESNPEATQTDLTQSRPGETDVGQPAPVLNGDLVYLQSVAPGVPNALVVGLPGATASGVTEVCAVLETSQDQNPVCFPVNPVDGSFRGVLENAEPCDTVDLWGEGEAYAPGGPGINSIPETVMRWYRPFPSSVNEVAVSAGKVYMAGEGEAGIYVADVTACTSEEEPDTFKVYTQAQGLVNDIVLSLAPGLIGDVWIGTVNGLSHLTYGENGEVIFSNYTNFGALPAVRIIGLAVEPTGAVWIAMSQNIVRMSIAADGNPQFEIFNVYSDFGISFSYVSGISVAPNGNVWISLFGYLVHLSSSELGIQKRIYQISNYLSYTYGEVGSTSSIVAVTDDHIWVGTYAGLVRVQTDSAGTPTFRVFSVSSTGGGLNNNFIRSLASGGSSDLWVGTSQGLTHVVCGESIDPVLTSYTSQTYPLFNDSVQAVAYDQGAGRVYLGTQAGLSSLSFTAAQEPQFKNYVHPDGLVNNYVTTLASDSQGRLWAGTGDGLSQVTFSPEGGVTFKNFNSVTHPTLNQVRIWTVGIGKQNDIWLGAMEGLYLLTLDSAGNAQINPISLPSQGNTTLHKWILSLAVGPDGDLWVGRIFDGLARVSIDAAGQPVVQTYTTSNGLPENSVTSLAIGTGDDVWVGTYSQGVVHFTLSSTGEPQFTTYTTANGLLGNEILALAKGADGEIWVRTPEGLSRLTQVEGGTIQIASFALGSPILDTFYANTMVVDGQGRVWLATSIGLQRVTVDMVGNVQLVTFTVNDGLPSNNIVAVAFKRDSSGQPDGGIFVGTPIGLTLFAEGALQ